MNIAGHIIVAALGLATVGGAVASKGKTPTTQNVNVVNTPNVNVANTPNVNVANTPNVSVTNTPSVNVANVPTIHPEDIRQPVFFNVSLDSDALGAMTPYDLGHPVPDGKQLVVTQVSALGYTPPGVTMTFAEITVSTNLFNPVIRHDFVPVFTTTNEDGYNLYSISEHTEFVVYSGQHVGCSFGRSSAPGGTPLAHIDFHISGYLEPDQGGLLN